MTDLARAVHKYQDKKTIAELAQMYQVSRMDIRSAMDEICDKDKRIPPIPRRRRVHHWTQEETKRLWEMYQAGIPQMDMAAELNISYDIINNKIKKLKISNGIRTDPRVFWTDEEDAEMLELRRQGLTCVQVAEKLGRTKNSVNARVCRLIREGRL